MDAESNLVVDVDPALFPHHDRMMGWIEHLSSWGHRKTGTPQGRASADFIAEQFRGFGLDVAIETAPTPCPTVHEADLSVAGESFPCFWVNATGRRDKLGAFRHDVRDAEIVYLGRGDDADYEGVDVTGKIVVCDIEFHRSGPQTVLDQHPRAEVFDATGSFATPRRKFDIYSPNSWPDNFFRAQNAGAAGFVGVLVDYMDSQNYNEDYSENGHDFGIDRMTLPAVWVSRPDGARIKALIAEPATTATLVVDIEYALGDALNVIGLLPGQSEDRILIHSHHDAVFAGAQLSSVRSILRPMDALTQQYVTWGIALLGLAGGVVGFFRSGRANKKARAADQLATQASLDAASAQKDIAAALSRMVEAPAPAVTWRLDQIGDSKWALRNHGNIVARSVTLGGLPNEASSHLMAAEHPDLEPGETYSFFISRTLGGPQIQSLQVVWLDETADHGLEKVIRVDW